MELQKMQPGYPCHKYLARNIKTEQDLWLYAKAFITTMVSQGTDWSVSIDLLIASLTEISSSSGLSCPDFLNLRLTAKESCLFIMNNDAVPVFRTCNSYYRKKDSKTPCCRLCPLSNIYYNANEQHEYEVLKYIFKCKDNFDFAMQYFDADFFKSAMDVAMEINMDKACVVPVLKEIVSSSLKPNLRLLLFNDGETNYFGNNTTAFDIAWEDAIARFPRERRVPAKLKNNPMWANVLKQYIYDKMMGSSDLEQENIRDIFDDYLALTIQQSVSKKEKEPVWVDIRLEDVITLEERTADKTTASEEPKDISDAELEDTLVNHDVAPSELVNNSGINSSSIEELDCKELSSVATTHVTDESVLNPVSGTGEIVFIEDNLYNLRSEDIVYEEHISNAIPPSSEVDKESENLSIDIPAESNSITPPSSPNKECDDMIYETASDGDLTLTMNRNMIVHCIFDEAIASEYCEILSTADLPEAAYQGILRDKSISLEIVLTTDNNYAYLIWSRHTKKYYYVLATAPSGNIYELLSRNMIRKICHTPYLLYGVSRLYGHVVKNVFSIQTVHCRVTGKTSVMSYEAIMTLYDMQKEFGRGISTEKKKACVFLAGLPYYKGIAHVLSDSLDHYEKPLLHIMDCHVDESIGYSYLYARNFNDPGYLVQLLPDGRHLYREEFLHIPNHPGYFISYTISNRDGATYIFRYLLYCLGRDGHMRKCNLQLTGMQKEYITFFVTDEYFDYITTIINMYLFEYSSLYPSQIIKVNQLTERCCKSKNNASQTA